MLCWELSLFTSTNSVGNHRDKFKLFVWLFDLHSYNIRQVLILIKENHVKVMTSQGFGNVYTNQYRHKNEEAAGATSGQTASNAARSCCLVLQDASVA